MRQNVHTVYDRMEAKGVFRSNSANVDSVDPMTGQAAYTGPVEFPRMVYHPKGARRVIMAAEAVMTPFGPQMLNGQSELINRIVNDQAEFEKALAEGWHEHPSDSVAAGFTPEDIAAGAVAPPKSAATRVASLEAQLAAMKKELELAKAGNIQSDQKKEEE